MRSPNSPSPHAKLIPWLLSGLLTLGAAIAPISAHAQDDMGAAMMAGELPDPIVLKEGDVTGLLKVAKELQALGLKLDENPTGPNFAERLAGQEKAKAILKRHNFTPERVQTVAYSVGLAMAAASGDLEESRAQMEEMKAMKDSMPPAQWAQMEKMMGPGLKMMEQALNQPKGNIALVKKYEDELNSLQD
ncbi:MAG: hypothetical protein AAF184_04680 [Pseudomonadota bacterium]